MPLNLRYMEKVRNYFKGKKKQAKTHILTVTSISYTCVLKLNNPFGIVVDWVKYLALKDRFTGNYGNSVNILLDIRFLIISLYLSV